MKRIFFTCVLGLFYNFLIAQKVSAIELFDSLYNNVGVRSIWAIDDNKQDRNRPVIIRIIDIKRSAFLYDSVMIDHLKGYGYYIVVDPKPAELANLNTGKFREAFVNTRLTRIPGKSEYLLRLIIYPYRCFDRFELSMHSVDVVFIKLNNRYKIKYVKCCGDAD